MAVENPSTTKKTLRVKTDDCIGCGLCAQMCPDVYELGEDGKSHVTNPSGDSKENIRQTIDACPVSAIEWKEVE